jgi:hypothetical protein
MCLIVVTKTKEEPKALIADRDIICYKVLLVEKDEHGETKFKTPYHDYNILLGKKYTTDEETDIYLDRDGSTFSSDYVCCVWELGAGIFHTYANYEDAHNDCETFRDGNCIVFAIIPKGTPYYYGDFCGSPCYGSKSLIITRNIAWLEDSKRLLERHHSATLITLYKLKEIYAEEMAIRDELTEEYNLPLTEDGWLDEEKMHYAPDQPDFQFDYDTE